MSLATFLTGLFAGMSLGLAASVVILVMMGRGIAAASKRDQAAASMESEEL